MLGSSVHHNLTCFDGPCAAKPRSHNHFCALRYTFMRCQKRFVAHSKRGVSRMCHADAGWRKSPCIVVLVVVVVVNIHFGFGNSIAGCASVCVSFCGCDVLWSTGFPPGYMEKPMDYLGFFKVQKTKWRLWGHVVSPIPVVNRNNHKCFPCLPQPP